MLVLLIMLCGEGGGGRGGIDDNDSKMRIEKKKIENFFMKRNVIS
jgi:hypothetical protein